MARPWRAATAGRREFVRNLGDERPHRAGGAPRSPCCAGRGAAARRLRAKGVDRVAGRIDRFVSAGAGTGSPCGPRAAALREDGACAPGSRPPLSVVARRTGRSGIAGRRRAAGAAVRHGVDGGRGAEPFRPPQGRRVSRRRSPAQAAAGGRGCGRRRSAAGPDDPGRFRLHRTGKPVGGHGTGAVRAGAGGAGGSGPLRGGVSGTKGHLPAGRDVRSSRRRRRSERHGLGAAGALRARVRAHRAVVERGRAALGGGGTQCRRAGGGTGGGSVQPRGRYALLAGTRHCAGGHRTRCDGCRVRAPRTRGVRGGDPELGARGRGTQRFGGQRAPPSGQRSGRGHRDHLRAAGVRGRAGPAPEHHPRFPQRPGGAGPRRPGSGARPRGDQSSGRRCHQQPDRPRCRARHGAGRRLLEASRAGAGFLRRRGADHGRSRGGSGHRDRAPFTARPSGGLGLAGLGTAAPGDFEHGPAC